MTPAALKTFRLLRTLNLPSTIIRKVTITADGKPRFTALDDNEFDVLKRAIRRVYPTYAPLAWQLMDPPDWTSGVHRKHPEDAGGRHFDLPASDNRPTQKRA